MNRRSFIKGTVLTGLAGLTAINCSKPQIDIEEPKPDKPKVFDKKLSFKQDGTFKILQFTDTHYIAGDPRSKRALDNVNQMLDLEKPDLVVHTGDVIFGQPPEASVREILWPIVSRKIPFVVALGNHDEEYGKSRQEILNIIMSLPYNLNTKTEGIYGVTNSVLTFHASKDDKIRRLLYILDSNRWSTIPDITDSYGHIHFDQIDWYRQKSEEYTKLNGGKPIPAFAFFHIPLPEHAEATSDTKNAKIIGTRGESVCCPKINSKLFVSMKEMGDVQAMFVGHDHNNDYAVYWRNMFFIYGHYSGGDTVYNDLKPNGARVITLYEDKNEFRSWIRLMGGSVIHDHNYPKDFL